jgi:hypothetical protein
MGFFDNLGAYRDQFASLITNRLRFISAPKPQVSQHWGYIRSAVRQGSWDGELELPWA